MQIQSIFLSAFHYTSSQNYPIKMKKLLKIILNLTPSIFVKLYLKMQGKVGANFSIDSGSILKCKNLRIGSNVRIGKNVIIIAENIEIGNRVYINDNTFIKAHNGFKIGNDSYIEDNNYIGGMQTSESYIEIGDRVGIFPRCYINTTKSVIIKNDVGIGGETLIFTHGTWQNILEGYPYSFGSVILEENVWLPWRVFILPNVTVGKNTTIGSASVISSNIEPNSFAAGVPCKVIKQNHKKEATFESKLKIMYRIFNDLKMDFEKIHGINFQFIDNETSLQLISNKVSILYTSDIEEADRFTGLVLINQKNISLKENWYSTIDYLGYYPSNNHVLLIIKFLTQYGIRFKYF